MKIRFNKPYIQGNELQYLKEVTQTGKLAGDGEFTRLCQQFFIDSYGFKKVFLTNSGTDALEMAALLLNIQEGEEVIMPSYTFVSTANAFELRGAKLKFADVGHEFPNIDPDRIEEVITKRTRAIVVVHYAGVSCDMDRIMEIARKYNLYVVEDAAQAIDSYYKDRPLGSIGDIGIFSFHESKNIVSGEGGLCIVNREEWIPRAEILWEKGTNRKAFNRGEVNKYTWVDVGSSFLPSELNAAFLYAQLEKLRIIQDKRLQIWNEYHRQLRKLNEKGHIILPRLPQYATNNAHIFFFLTKSRSIQRNLLQYLNDAGIKAIFHYIPLHSSPYFSGKTKSLNLDNTDRYSNTIVRLPLYCELTSKEQDFIVGKIYEYFNHL